PRRRPDLEREAERQRALAKVEALLDRVVEARELLRRPARGGGDGVRGRLAEAERLVRAPERRELAGRKVALDDPAELLADLLVGDDLVRDGPLEGDPADARGAVGDLLIVLLVDLAL